LESPEEFPDWVVGACVAVCVNGLRQPLQKQLLRLLRRLRFHLLRRIDPDRRRLPELSRDPMDRSYWMQIISSLEDLLPVDQHLLCPAIVNLSRSQQSDSRVVMHMVVPTEEVATPASSACLRVKALGVSVIVLEGLEVRFRVLSLIFLYAHCQHQTDQPA
jgi:hypothetical protein